jgi:carboxymethylenebutenolidase
MMATELMELNPRFGATTAHVAIPDGDVKPRAAVVLMQEYWGINDNIRNIASRYAKEGYICVAPDLYRGKLAKNPKEAMSLMSSLTMEDGMETIKSAIDETRNKYGIDKFAITGYCMGGTYAFRAACEIETLKASAVFYGDVPDEETLAKLKVPVLFIAGARDQWINTQKVEQLKEAARKYKLPVEVVTYDADHAFFNDTRPEVYNPEAAADAWRRVLGFFAERLKSS